MQVNITARHGELCQATQDKMADRAGRLDRYAGRLSTVDITVDLGVGDKPHVSGHAFTNRGVDLVASNTSSNLWGSLDKVLKSLRRQLQKRKDKMTRRHSSYHDTGISLGINGELRVPCSDTDEHNGRYNGGFPASSTNGKHRGQDDETADNVKRMRQLFEVTITSLRLANATVQETHLSVCGLLHQQAQVNDELRTEFAKTRSMNRANHQQQTLMIDEVTRMRHMFESTLSTLELANATVHETYVKACGLLNHQLDHNDRLRNELADVPTTPEET